MTPKERVLKDYPKAYCADDRGDYAVWSDGRRRHAAILGKGTSEAVAWHYAALGLLPLTRLTSEAEAFDTVDRPEHYASAEIECIDAIQAQLTPEEFRGYLKGNVAKYLWRERMKGGVESLKKAEWYLKKLTS